MMDRQEGRMGGKAALLAGTVLAGMGMMLPASAQEAPAAMELAPVQVEAAQPQPQETTTFITQERIDHEQPQSLKDLFRNETSVMVGGGGMASQKIYVHGIEQDKLNVSVDGVPQPGNVWHHNGTLTIDPMFLKVVEVDAGVAPADAGPGALGGAIRMETKDATDMLLPGQKAGGTAILSYNTNSETIRTTGAGYMVQDGFEVLGLATRARGENYKNGGSDIEPGTADDLLSGLAKLAYEAKSGDRVEASVELAEDEGVRRLRPNMGVVNNQLNFTRSERLTTMLSYGTTKPTDHYDPKIEVYYNRALLHRPNDNNVAPANWTRAGVFNSKIETIGGKAQNTFVIPTGTLTAGMDVRNTDMFVMRYINPVNVDEQIRNVGLFAQARVAPVDSLKVSTGLRGDYQAYHAADEQDFKNAGLSPNLSAEYALNDQVSAFGGYSYNWAGLEMPEIGLYHAGNVAYSSDLEPATAHNFKTGLRYGHNGLALEGSVFRTLMKNTVLIQGATANRLRVNGPDLVATGFDLAARQTWDNAHIGAKYTYTDTQYDGRMALPGDYLAAPGGHLISLDASYTVEPYRLTFGGSMEAALRIADSDLTSNGFTPIKSYQVFNLFAEWQPAELVENWTLRVEGNNLNDAKYISRGTYSTGATVTPVYSEGRSFLLSSVLKF